jgi:hypothetical protein
MGQITKRPPRAKRRPRDGAKRLLNNEAERRKIHNHLILPISLFIAPTPFHPLSTFPPYLTSLYNHLAFPSVFPTFPSVLPTSLPFYSTITLPPHSLHIFTCLPASPQRADSLAGGVARTRLPIPLGRRVVALTLAGADAGVARGATGSPRLPGTPVPVH